MSGVRKPGVFFLLRFFRRPFRHVVFLFIFFLVHGTLMFKANTFYMQYECFIVELKEGKVRAGACQDVIKGKSCQPPRAFRHLSANVEETSSRAYTFYPSHLCVAKAHGHSHRHVYLLIREIKSNASFSFLSCSLFFLGLVFVARNSSCNSHLSSIRRVRNLPGSVCVSSHRVPVNSPVDREIVARSHPSNTFKFFF